MSFVRYNQAPSNRLSPSEGASLNNPIEYSLGTETLTMGLTQTLSPKLVNEVRLNGSRQSATTQNVINSTGGAQRPPDSLFFPEGYSSNDSGFSFAVGPSPGLGVGFNGRDGSRQLEIVDNLSWSSGAHQFKAGADYRWFSPVTTVSRFDSIVIFDGIYGPIGCRYGHDSRRHLNFRRYSEHCVCRRSIFGLCPGHMEGASGAHSNLRIAVGSRSGAPGERRASGDPGRNHKFGQSFDRLQCAVRKTVLRYFLVEFSAAIGDWLADT